jgi:hypothetical protein
MEIEEFFQIVYQLYRVQGIDAYCSYLGNAKELIRSHKIETDIS